MRHRRGVSLLELLLAMTALCVILTLSVNLIHRILLAQMRSHAAADAERTALRLTSIFRRDVWQARSVVTAEGDIPPGTLVLLSLLNDQSLEYRHEDAALMRLFKEGERTIARERFTLPERTTAHVERQSENLLLLSLVKLHPARSLDQTEQPPDAYAPGFALQVQARIGRDAAFLAHEPKAEAGP